MRRGELVAGRALGGAVVPNINEASAVAVVPNINERNAWRPKAEVQHPARDDTVTRRK